MLNAPLSGNRTPGSNQYRCFLSDLTGFSAQPPSGFPPHGNDFPTAFAMVRQHFLFIKSHILLIPHESGY